MNEIQKNYLKRILMVFSISGIIYYILMINIRHNIEALKLDDNILKSITLNDIPSMFEIIIFLLSVVLLLTLPTLTLKNKLETIIILTSYITIIMLELIVFFELRLTGVINNKFIIITFIFTFLTVWLLIELLKYIYEWTKLKTKNQTFDLAKMTFLWAVITFILNLLWIGR